MCPILRAGIAPTSGNMSGRKRGEGRHCRPSPELGARFLKGRVYAGVAPTGSLFIDMPQFVTSGSPERWAMCPMFALAWPIVCHRNPRWPGALTLEYLWARLSTITRSMRSAGVGRPTDIYDLKVRVRMSQEMMDKTCRGFAEALAAREPVPGGGSASAFVGALGASLCGMVARYGATNPALADRADDLTRAFAQADELSQELVELVAEDVRAYGQVSTAYGIPRDDPARATAIQDALHVAAMPPYRIMDACGRALALLEDMADKGSRQLLSDVACGAVFCRSAMQGASLTLFANTTSMKDRTRAEELETACDELLDTWLPRADALARRASDAARKRG